jgi:hypothetical protein
MHPGQQVGAKKIYQIENNKNLSKSSSFPAEGFCGKNVLPDSL